MPFLRRCVVPLSLVGRVRSRSSRPRRSRRSSSRTWAARRRASRSSGAHPARWAEDGKHVALKEAEGRVLHRSRDRREAGAVRREQAAVASGPGRGADRGSRSADKTGVRGEPRREARGVRPQGRGGSKDAENLVVEDAGLEAAGGGNEWQVTQARAGEMFGRLDWVYQEEVYGRGNFKGFWWSPDSKWIAFLGLDEERA